MGPLLWRICSQFLEFLLLLLDSLKKKDVYMLVEWQGTKCLVLLAPIIGQPYIKRKSLSVSGKWHANPKIEVCWWPNKVEHQPIQFSVPSLELAFKLEALFV